MLLECKSMLFFRIGQILFVTVGLFAYHSGLTYYSARKQLNASCPGSRYPAAIRDPLPGNNHHPNVCFRVALFLVVEDTSTGITPVTM